VPTFNGVKVFLLAKERSRVYCATSDGEREEAVQVLKQAVEKHIFAEAPDLTFAVLDGAAIPDLLEKLYAVEPQHECLYMGDLEPDMAEVAPYLVQLEPQSDFANWVIGMGWGKHWGIFLQTSADFRAMRQHFRRFLVIYNEEGRPLMFRFYDPRVLRRHFPKCKPEELSALFGPVVSYVVEDEDPNAALRFTLDSGALKPERLSLDER
jgi:hypothetical protein